MARSTLDLLLLLHSGRRFLQFLWTFTAQSGEERKRKLRSFFIYAHWQSYAVTWGSAVSLKDYRMTVLQKQHQYGTCKPIRYWRFQRIPWTKLTDMQGPLQMCCKSSDIFSHSHFLGSGNRAIPSEDVAALESCTCHRDTLCAQMTFVPLHSPIKEYTIEADTSQSVEKDTQRRSARSEEMTWPIESPRVRHDWMDNIIPNHKE